MSPWTKLAKPTDGTIVTSVTTTSILHAKGKFMGILGLTYPGVVQSVTTTSVTSLSWSPIAKPNGGAFNPISNPSGDSWSKMAKPTD